MTEEEIDLLQEISASQKLDLVSVMESWMKMATAVVSKARDQLQFDSECGPDTLARQSLLKCSNAVKKLEDIGIDKAADEFLAKWNEKVCC